MIALPVLAWASTAGVLVLLAGYGIGAPWLLFRTLHTLNTRRRLRYRPADDRVLATSRFTIPVSLIVTLTEDTVDPASSVQKLLDVRYPEAELIVVTNGARAALDVLRREFELNPCELFFRRTLRTANPGVIYRSASQPRLLVAEVPGGPEGDALNCGINLARYRYVCVAEPDTDYDRDGLLEAMQAATEDPAHVVGITTNLRTMPAAPATDAGTFGLAAALTSLAAARLRLLTIARRRLDLPPGGCPGFRIWRRDVVVEVGGFSHAPAAIHADMAFRVHRHFSGNRDRYRLLHLAAPVGAVRVMSPAASGVRAGFVPWSVVWAHRAMAFNYRLGRLGLLDYPAYAVTLVAAPWLELLALVLLAAALPLGVLAPNELLLVLGVIAFGSGIVATSALLLSGDGLPDRRPGTLLTLILVGPFEYFLTRPPLLGSRLTGRR